MGYNISENDNLWGMQLVNNNKLEFLLNYKPFIYNDSITITPNIDKITLYNNQTTSILQRNAELKTGVKGWRLVRFRPNSLSSNWYSYNDNAMGTQANDGNAYDYTNQWTVLFGDFDELLFSTYNMEYWLRATKAELQISGYSDTARTVLSSSRTFTQHTVKWYNRTGVNEDPFVSLYDHIDYATQGQSHMYCLYSDGNSIHHRQLLQDSSLGGMCVFVRKSTDTTSASIIQDTILNTDNQNLLLHWKFDDNDNIFKDSVTNKNLPISYMNGSTPIQLTDGIINNALDLDTITQDIYYDIPTSLINFSTTSHSFFILA